MMHSKGGYGPLGRNTADLYAEFRDEVDKYNRKQDLLLAKHIRVINRQERVMDSFLKKNRHEIEQLKADIRDSEARSMDLHEYDNLKYFQKVSGYGNVYKYISKNNKTEPGNNVNNQDYSPRGGVKLPPLWQKGGDFPGGNSKGAQNRLMQDFEPKALSVRALKRTSTMSLLTERGQDQDKNNNHLVKRNSLNVLTLNSGANQDEHVKTEDTVENGDISEDNNSGKEFTDSNG